MNTAALVILSLAAFAFTYRLLRGPTVPDRAVALDGLLSSVVMGIIVAEARRDISITLTTVLVVALAGFIGATALARFIERRGG